jgi:GTP cyclohydrolase I
MLEREEKIQVIEESIKTLLDTMGEDTSREGLLKTPHRVAKMYVDEMFRGLGADLKGIINSAIFTGDGGGMVVVGSIPFYTMCEHHLVPFYGKAYVGYIPENKKVTGLSKIARVVELAAKQPQVQEKMGQMIADALYDSDLQPEGVGVVLVAEHLCMAMRGIQKPGSKTITCDVRGSFRNEPETRAEFLSHVDRID